MDLIFGFKVGRLGFCLFFIISLAIYGTASLYITHSGFILVITRLIIMVASLIVYISCIVRRLHDLGRKKQACWY